ncbi:MAG TPA: hypothetical protein VH592_01940 [Gemmataceae bacterium]|jgi:hypothetical protein
MRKIALLLLSVSLLAAKDDEDAKKPKPRFPLGKETTYVTEPLDTDGYIDYAAALNERLRRDVTPENNANVLIWKALGPRSEGAPMPEEFFKWLEIKPPPEVGDYFIPMGRYAREQLKLAPRPGVIAIQEELSLCSQRAWKASEHPNIAAWLKANEKPLAVALEATKRTHYYSPLVSKRTRKEPEPLFLALMPSMEQCRRLAQALAARAFLRIDEGRFEDAWQDLLACHRIGRHLAQGAANIELLVGIIIDSNAGRADLAFLERAHLKSEQINKCLRDLRALPPMPVAADKMDLGERFMILDVVVILDRDGVESLVAAQEEEQFLRFFQRKPNYESTLRNVNHLYDRMAKAMRGKDRKTRQKELAPIGKELAELDMKIPKLRPTKLELLLSKDRDKIVGEYIGNLVIGSLTPAVHRVQNASDQCEQNQNNLYLAFALAAYHRDHGRYPKELGALAPKYLDRIPDDVFSEKPLIYRPDENGYLLYSVGVNGQDEQGRTSDDQPQGDDLSIRMPLPKLKQK